MTQANRDMFAPVGSSVSRRLARMQLGLTLEAMAAALGVSVSYLSRIERHLVSPEDWIRRRWERTTGVAWADLSIDEVAVAERPAGQLELSLGLDSRDWVADLLPVESLVSSGPPPQFAWDIPQTIPQLAYLTHNYYRYYGKFPATVPRKLLRDYRPPAGTWVLDNFSGCGTTLVEAKCEGIPSLGIDISPLATLAGSVKTTIVSTADIRTELRQTIEAARRMRARANAVPEKWFDPRTALDLSRLKASLLAREDSDVRRFLVLAFFAIIRRVSRAHDGEVRPHVNETKRARDVFDTYSKKVLDMTQRMDEFAKLASDTPAVAVTGDSRVLDSMAVISDKPIGMVISHPPYLNCFDYVPVYRLEYMWAESFAELGADFDYFALKAAETRCWPATDERIFKSYFSDLKSAYGEVAHLLKPGAYCAVVLGDCTVGGRVVPVLDRFTELMADVGFELDRTFLRSTHYGVGKYAYADRADYHGTATEKRDGILLFKRGGRHTPRSVPSAAPRASSDSLRERQRRNRHLSRRTNQPAFSSSPGSRP